MKTKTLVFTAIIAALYTTITYLFHPLSYGPIQIRFACILYPLTLINPIFTFGIGLGVFLADLGSPFGAFDFVPMPFIAMIAGYTGWLLRDKPWIATIGQALIISVGVAIFPLYLGGRLNPLITFPGIFISQIVVIVPSWFLIWSKHKTTIINYIT